METKLLDWPLPEVSHILETKDCSSSLISIRLDFSGKDIVLFDKKLQGFTNALFEKLKSAFTPAVHKTGLGKACRVKRQKVWKCDQAHCESFGNKTEPSPKGLKQLIPQTLCLFNYKWKLNLNINMMFYNCAVVWNYASIGSKWTS